MKDITFCSPTKLRKRCATCYRRRLFPDERQSWSNFYDKCNEYYMEEVSIDEYNKRMDKIIDKKMDIGDKLIALLDEAQGLRIKKQVTRGRTKHGKRHNKSNTGR
jgi:regulator of sigma D